MSVNDRYEDEIEVEPLVPPINRNSFFAKAVNVFVSTSRGSGTGSTCRQSARYGVRIPPKRGLARTRR